MKKVLLVLAAAALATHSAAAQEQRDCALLQKQYNANVEILEKHLREQQLSIVTVEGQSYFFSLIQDRRDKTLGTIAELMSLVEVEKNLAGVFDLNDVNPDPGLRMQRTEKEIDALKALAKSIAQDRQLVTMRRLNGCRTYTALKEMMSAVGSWNATQQRPRSGQALPASDPRPSSVEQRTGLAPSPHTTPAQKVERSNQGDHEGERRGG